MSTFNAKLYTNNNMLNVVDGRGVTQTFYFSEGKQGYTWRDYDGQIAVRKTPGTLADFSRRLEESNLK